MKLPVATAAVLRIQLRLFAVGLTSWAVLAATVLVLISLGINHWGEPDRSIWAYAGSAVRWLLFVIGILLVPMLFRVMIAHGITRRTYTVATGALVGVLAGATGVYMAAGFLFERVLYWEDPPATRDGPHLFDSTGALHLIFAEYALIAGGFLISGWLISAGYMRFGWLGGTACAIAAFLPATAVELALGTRGGPSAAPYTSSPDLPVGLALPLAVAAIALGLTAGHWLLGATPIRPKAS